MEQIEIKTTSKKEDIELIDGEQLEQTEIFSDIEHQLNFSHRRKNSTRKESIISLENEIKNLRCHIEEDERLIDDKLKEMSEREILDKDLKMLQKEILDKTRKKLDIRENLIWQNLEENLKYLRDQIEKDDQLIINQHNHIKEQQNLIESQCNVIQELVKISKEQQEEMINFNLNRKLRFDTNPL